MRYTILGRTGLNVSVAGLGCGGASRLGLSYNRTDGEAIALVRQAVDLGVNLLDTAESYGTEHIVGKAIRDIRRDLIVLSTKTTLPPAHHPHADQEVQRALEQSLRHLQTDYVDVYHLHAVKPRDYSYAGDRILPTLLRLRREGKIRFVGITEAFGADPGHDMLRQALADGCWDVVMVGFNMLNHSARTVVFQESLKKQIGVLAMFAVRRALSQPARLAALWAELKQKGSVASDGGANPLDFLIRDRIAATIPEAAYRYCRHEPGVHVVLTGTGDSAHLRSNLKALVEPPLPEWALRRLDETFGRVDGVTGD